MPQTHSFAEFVKDKCYNGLYQEAEKYVDDNWEHMNLYTKKVHRIGHVELSDAVVQRVYVHDLPEMKVAFETAIELEIEVHEEDYHYDETDTCYPWIRIFCEGDLSCALDDWKIIKVELYSKKKAPMNSLSDALVPYIPYNQLDKAANDFLKRYYPEALKITPNGQPPICVDPLVMAERMGLNVQQKRIREDASVFGQIYFEDTDANLFDAKLGEEVREHINAGTILFDPKIFLLRNLGCANNTIIHECVHWDKHRKVFALEKLYNENASNISCEVVGGAASSVAQSATEQMEKQANQLTPRIQMPADSFRIKANYYIGKFMRDLNARHTNEVMEQVIIQLATDFGVSRQAAKIRLVELGFDEAIGTYTYLDGHYVKPHSFRKGALEVNQTFSIPAQDAAIERLINPELRKMTADGDYLFVDNHYVYNAPLYVQRNESGKLDLTDYARAHMDECCLVFDMKITSQVRDEYHTVCYLNRDKSNVSFELHFHNGYENAPKERQVAMRMREKAEALEIRKQMTDDQAQCMDLLLNWRKMKYTELGDEIDRDPKTISRIAKGEKTTLETAALICLGLHLPPSIGLRLMEVMGHPLRQVNPEQQWIFEALTTQYANSVDAVREYLAPYGVEL